LFVCLFVWFPYSVETRPKWTNTHPNQYHNLAKPKPIENDRNQCKTNEKTIASNQKQSKTNANQSKSKSKQSPGGVITITLSIIRIQSLVC
jgi:hypothetical protein